MSITLLHPDTLYGAIITGCRCVKSAQSQLNEINVFPVADGDTGDNMASTALSIIHHSQSKSTPNALFSSVAEASIRGARGNSGIIFSQFFNFFWPRKSIEIFFP
jgi:dihydroxyacetone kinase-like predicted kinase